MVHRKLLAVLLACCLGLSLVAAQPALAGDGSGTTLFGADSDGLIQENLTGGLIQQDDDESDTREGTDQTETTDGETDDEETDPDDGDGESDDSWGDRDDNESDDEDGWGGHSDNESADDDGWGDDGDDDHRWGEQNENESDTESSDSHEGMWDSERRNESDTETDDGNSSDNDSDADASEERFNGSSDGEENGTDAGNETRNSTGVNETLDGFLLDDVTDIVVDMADVTTNVTADVTRDATDDAVLRGYDANDWTTDRDSDDGARIRPSSALDRTFDDDELDGTLETSGLDDLASFVTIDDERGAIAGVRELVTELSSASGLVSDVVSVLADAPAEDGDEQLASDESYEGAVEEETRDVEERTGARASSIPLARSDSDAADERSDEDEAAGADSDDGEAPPSGPGEGAALLVLVGYLGGGRLTMNQATMLASMGQPGLLGSLKQSITSHLGGLSDPVVPPVFGYSRHDSSDPLENETRARIFELVEESPGMYYAQLAEETDVTVETIRYHCRILADEGLVERRKLRGRQRLYPVSMDGDDPELAAAMADSAAADVLSAIERREPTTLSAVAEAIDCAPSTVSYHLDRLEEDGLVSRERDGGSVRIRLRRATKSALQGSVADD